MVVSRLTGGGMMRTFLCGVLFLCASCGASADEVAERTLANAKRVMGFTLPGDKKLPKLR